MRGMRVGVSVLVAAIALGAGCVFDLPDVISSGAGGTGQGGGPGSSSSSVGGGGGGGGGAGPASGTVVSLGLVSANAAPSAVAIESDGSVLVGGVASATVDFGVGSAGPGGFVARFDPETGLAAWVLQLEGGVRSVSMTAADGGGAYVAVQFQGSLTLDGNAYFGPPNGIDATLVFRLDGEVVTWVDDFSGGGDAEDPRVAALPDGGVAIIGTIRGGAVDLGGGVQVSSSSGTRGYVARIAPDGTPEWADVISGANDIVPSGVAPSTVAGSVLVSGISRSTSFDGACTFPANGDPQAFLARYDGVGQCAAGLGWGDPQSVLPTFVATSTTNFVAGLTDRDLDFDALGPVPSGATVGYVAAISPTGEPDWAVRISGSAGADQEVWGLAASARGPVVAGRASGATDFGAGSVPGGNDAFVVTYDPAGAHRWALRAVGGASTANAVATRGGRVAVVGTSSGDVDFGGGFTTAGMSSAFVLLIVE